MPDAGIAAADIPPAPGLLAAGGGGQAIPQQTQLYQAPSDLRQPLPGKPDDDHFDKLQGSLADERRRTPAPGKSADSTIDGAGSVSARNRANNNPGNIKSLDGGYMSFATPQAGIDAIGNWLIRAQNQHGLATVRELIDDSDHGYAPSADPGNQGKHLPEAAARAIGVDPDQPVNMNDPAMRQKMVGAILMQEQGGSEANANRDWGGQLAEESRANTAAELASIERDRSQLMREISKEAPGTAKRMQMLEEAHEASKRATELYEKQMSTPPIYQPTDVFAGWGGIVMALAALAGRRSAQPLTAALNGMAGAMEGMNSSNKEQFDRSFKVWERQTDFGLKLVDIQNQEIRSILEDQRLSDAEKQANLTNIYHLFEMDREAAAARRGDVQSQWQHLEHMERMTQEAQWHREEIKHWHDELKQQKELAEAKMSPGQIAGRVHDDLIEEWKAKPENEGKEVPPEVDAAAWDAARSTSPRSAPAMFLDAYRKENPGSTAAQLANAMGEYRRIQTLDSAFAGGVLGRQVVSLNTVADHLLLAREYFEALNNGQIPRANQLANAIAVEFGKPEVTNFRAGRDIMADEVVRLLTSTGGTEADRAGMQSRLDDFFSPDQGKGVLTALDRFVGGRFKALEQQFAQGDQQRQKYFTNNILTSESRDLRERVRKSSPGAAEASASDKATVSFGGKLFAREPAGAIDVPSNLKDVPDGKIVGDDSAHYIKEGGKLILLVPAGQ